MALAMEVGLGPGHIVLDGDPASLPKRGQKPLQFSAQFYCGQTAAVTADRGLTIAENFPSATLISGKGPFRGGARNFCVEGPKIQWGLGGRGTPTKLTKSLDLHDCHKCHRSTLGLRTPGLPAHRRLWTLLFRGRIWTPYNKK